MSPLPPHPRLLSSSLVLRSPSLLAPDRRIAPRRAPRDLVELHSALLDGNSTVATKLVYGAPRRVVSKRDRSLSFSLSLSPRNREQTESAHHRDTRSFQCSPTTCSFPRKNTILGKSNEEEDAAEPRRSGRIAPPFKFERSRIDIECKRKREIRRERSCVNLDSLKSKKNRRATFERSWDRPHRRHRRKPYHRSGR